MTATLELHDHVFREPREILCLAVALLLHAPLLFWRAQPDAGPLGDPIVGVDFIVEEETPPEVAPPKKEEPESESFFEKVQKMVGLSTKPAPIEKLLQEPAKPELAGMAPTNAIQVTRKVESILGSEKLTDKSRGGLSGAIDVGNIKTESALSAGGVGVGAIALGGGTIKDKSTAYRVGKGDLPFALKTARGGGLLSEADPDAPRIAVVNRSDKGIKSVSSAFFGTGGGNGSGDGSGGTLKDKGGLSGSSGGFAGIDDLPGGGSPGGRGLAGTDPGGSGSGVGGGSGRVPFEITGALSNRKILQSVLPPYPDWAREKGLIATVGLEFSVSHTGVVKKNITVQRSSGYPLMDEVAMTALLKWRFAPLPEAQYGEEQTGVITFKFRAL